MPPQVHRLFSPTDAPGLMSVLPMAELESGEKSTSTELDIGVTGGVDGSGGHLTLMANTGRERSTGRLLSPLILTREIQENQRLVDLTIVDAPALLEFADAIPLLPAVDGVLVVADAGATRRSELEELADLLDGTGARVIGSVLNRDGSRVVSRRARRARHRSNVGRTKRYGRRSGASPSAVRDATPRRSGHDAAGDAGPNGTARAADPSSGPDIFTNRTVRPVTILPNTGKTPDGDVGWPA
jgi:hypothetical protein